MPDFETPYVHLENHANKIGDEIAIGAISGDTTWLQLQFEVDRIAAKLRFVGIQPKQVVLLLGENVFLWKLQLALFKLGALPCVVSSPEVPVYLHNDVFVSDREFKTNAHRKLVIDPAWIKDAMANFKPVPVEAGYAENDPIRLMLTSGTTGTPKAAIIPFSTFKTRTSLASANWAFPQPEFSMMGFSSAVGFWAAMRSLTAGTTFVSPTGMAKNVAALVQKYSVRTLVGSPVQLQGESENWLDNDPRLVTVETIIPTGSAAGSKLIETLQKKSPAKLLSRFGSTEAGGVSERILTQSSPDEKWIGNLLAGAEVRILDQNHNEVAPGAVGHLVARTYSMATGYWKNDEETKKRFIDGWFATGDLAYVDEDGNVILSARDTDLINMGGVKVDPDRVDLILSAHPDVLESGTFSITRSNGQTLAVSAIIMKQNGNVEEIRKYMKSKLVTGSSKLIVPVPEIPRNNNGKLDRKKLSELYAKRILDHMDAVDAKRRV